MRSARTEGAGRSAPHGHRRHPSGLALKSQAGPGAATSSPQHADGPPTSALPPSLHSETLMYNEHPPTPAPPAATPPTTPPATPPATASRVRVVLSRGHGQRFSHARSAPPPPPPPPTPSPPPPSSTCPPSPPPRLDGPPLLRSPHGRASHHIPESELPPWLLETARQLSPEARATAPTVGDVRTTHADRRARRAESGALDLRNLPPLPSPGPTARPEHLAPPPPPPPPTPPAPSRPPGTSRPPARPRPVGPPPSHTARADRRRRRDPVPSPPHRTGGEWMLFTAWEALPYSCTVVAVVLLARLLGLFG